LLVTIGFSQNRISFCKQPDQAAIIDAENGKLSYIIDMASVDSSQWNYFYYRDKYAETNYGISLTTDANGTVENVNSINFINPNIDPKLVGTLMAMKRWKPGYLNSIAVRSQVLLIINMN
jgi:hypothetical protein